MQPNGYKKLKHNPLLKKTPPISRYQPGDGFAGREAKPIGLNLLTRNVKPSIAGPHVGMLDLTQSAPLPTKQKRSLRKAQLDDNAFAPAPKKKAARRPETRIADEVSGCQPNTEMPGQHEVEMGSAARTTTAGDAEGESAARKEGTRHVEIGNAQNNFRRRTEPHPSVPEKTALAAGFQTDLNGVIIERSDELLDESGRIIQRGPLPEKEQDSCGTHVSDTPPRRLRANSASSAPSPRRDPPNATLQPRERIFRRVNTQ
ncbi:hypothetical protein VTK56DRAFT_271 [Thermocarpiscus australiensis]